MEYNKMLRLYYRGINEVFNGVELEPMIVNTVGDNANVTRYLSDIEYDWQGVGKIRPEAPNEVYQLYFDKYRAMYPEFYSIFPSVKMIKGMTESFNDYSDIISTLKTLLIVYKQAGMVR